MFFTCRLQRPDTIPVSSSQSDEKRDLERQKMLLIKSTSPLRLAALAVLTLMLAALLLVAAGCQDDSSQTASETAPPQAEQPTVTATTTAGAGSTGSPFGFHPAEISKPGYSYNGFTDALSLGLDWSRAGVYAFWFLVQPDLGSKEYDFSLYDKQWGSVPESIRILGNIAPQGPKDEGRCQKGTFLPVDEAQYRAFVTATIERYDGDGVSDMPGLKNPITYWQVGNEPDASRTSGFASLQKMTYEAIKQACPSCQVLIGGVAGMPDGYIKGFDEKYAPILRELKGRYVDIFDFHWYGKADGDYLFREPVTGEDALDHIRKELAADGFAPDMPIWITEMGAYSGDPVAAQAPAGVRDLIADGGDNPPQTEGQQAGDYFRRYIYSTSRGVEKVFGAFGLIEGFKHDDGYFDHTGLIYDGMGPDDPGMGVKKLGYYTFKKMTESLDGADWTTLETLHDGAATDRLFLFRIMKDGEPVYIAWWDYFDDPAYVSGATRNLVIEDLGDGELRVTSVIPRAVSGSQVTDYATAFTELRVPAEDGSATLTIGEEPVIVTVEAGAAR